MVAKIIATNTSFTLKAGKKGTGKVLHKVTCWDTPTAQRAAYNAIMDYAHRYGIKVVSEVTQ
jgi:hypothetical protein